MSFQYSLSGKKRSASKFSRVIPKNMIPDVFVSGGKHKMLSSNKKCACGSGRMYKYCCGVMEHQPSTCGSDVHLLIH